MQKLRIGFMGSPDFAADLLESLHKGLPHIAGEFASKPSARKTSNKTSNRDSLEIGKKVAGLGRKFPEYSNESLVLSKNSIAEVEDALPSSPPSSIVCHVWTNSPRQAGRGNRLRPTAVAQRAKTLGLALSEVSAIAKTPDGETVELLRSLDFVVVVAFGQLLPSWFFSAPSLGCLNIHFSLLPLFRGASPVQSAILAGVKESGVTLQTIATALDAGDIVMQEKIRIANLATDEVLQKKLPICRQLLQNFMADPQRYLEARTPQDAKAATYCRKIQAADARLRVGDKCEDFRRKFLAYKGWPNLFFTINNERFEVLEYGFLAEGLSLFSNFFPVGSFFAWKPEAKHLETRSATKKQEKLLVVLLDGAVEIKKLKRQGRAAVDAKAFINGFRRHLPTTIDLD